MATYETLAANGTTSPTHHVVFSRNIPGVQLTAIGTWGGGTLVVEQLHDDGTWRAVTGASYTSDTSDVVDVANETYVRATLSGSTSPSLFIEFANMDKR